MIPNKMTLEHNISIKDTKKTDLLREKYFRIKPSIQ